MATGKVSNGPSQYKTCPICGTRHTKRQAATCSKSCGARMRHKTTNYAGANNPNWKGGSVTYACEQCGEKRTIGRQHGKKRFCSLVCANLWQSNNPYPGAHNPYSGLGIQRVERIVKQCRQCGNQFEVLPCHVPARFFCTHECQFKWRSIRNSGENNPNWNGGTSKEPYPFSWAAAREKVLKRDGDACISPRCRKVSTKINVHHVDYVKKNCRTDNLITVCASCNARANFNRDGWTQYFRELLTDLYGYEYV